MARYIDADSLYSRVKTHTNPYGKPSLDYESGLSVMRMIEQEPTADVQEIRHGKWVRSSHKIVCSVCGGNRLFDKTNSTIYCKKGYHISLNSKYCPHCGAKMDGKET